MILQDWLSRNAERLGALAALATAFAALSVLVVVPWQIAAADRIQRDQTAREIYREFLNLTVQKPELATADFCTLEEPAQIAAYSAYVDYLFYTAEQMIDTSPEWRDPMAGYLKDHMAYLCSTTGGRGGGDIAATLADLTLTCAPDPPCP